MKYYNYVENKASTINSNKYNLLYKQNKISIQKYKNKNNPIYKNNNEINRYKYNLINEKNNRPPINNSNFIKSNNTRSYVNFNQDINFIKIKTGFDLLTQKINAINDSIQLIYDSNKRNTTSTKIRNNPLENIYFRDKIGNKNNVLNNNYMKKIPINNNNISSQSQHYLGSNPSNTDNMNNYYSIENNINNNINNYLYKNKSHIFINKNNNCHAQSYYNNFYSLEGEKTKKNNELLLNTYKYNSQYNLGFLNDNINNNNITNYHSYQNSKSIDNIHNQNYKHRKRRERNMYNYFQLTKNKIKSKLGNMEMNKNRKNSAYFANQRLNNFLNKDNYLENNDNDNDNDNENDSFSIYKDFGSFDNYFIDNPKFKENNLKDYNNNNNTEKINVIYKNDKIQNHNNYNIFNFINKDKIIQNNFIKLNNNINIKNKSNLKIENQKSVSYFGHEKKKNGNNNNIYEESDSFEDNEKKSLKFKENQLQQCSTNDIFLPKKNIIKINNEKEKEKLKEEEKINLQPIELKNINKTVIKEIKVNKRKKVICKDDFYYDLYAEKIFSITKNNNSIDEEYKLSDIKDRIYDKFENKNKNIIINNNIDKKIKQKKVRFFEGDNHYIQINQEEKVTKFSVFNHLGNKIYFKHCNFNQYLKELKSNKNKTKSILINKNIDNSENSEWNKIFDIINKIKNKSKFNEADTIKKNGFKIKNIESFKKNGVKITSKNKKIKEENLKKNYDKNKINKNDKNINNTIKSKNNSKNKNRNINSNIINYKYKSSKKNK